MTHQPAPAETEKTLPRRNRNTRRHTASAQWQEVEEPKVLTPAQMAASLVHRGLASRAILDSDPGSGRRRTPKAAA